MEPKRSITFPETNSEFTPENGWLEYDELSFWELAYFQVRTVSLRGVYMGVSKNRGTPKWMVYNGKPH